jgi:hypothetical protein
MFREQSALKNLMGTRSGKTYQTLNGGFLVDEPYPFEYIGNSFMFKVKGVDDEIEIIDDINFIVLYIRCEDCDQVKSQFLYEFYKDDKEFYAVLDKGVWSALQDFDI